MLQYCFTIKLPRFFYKHHKDKEEDCCNFNHSILHASRYQLIYVHSILHIFSGTTSCHIHVNIGYHNLFSILYTITSVFSHFCMQFHDTSDPAKAILTGQPRTAICNNCGSRQQLCRITHTVKHSVGDILAGTKPLDRYVLYILVFKSSPP